MEVAIEASLEPLPICGWHDIPDVGPPTLSDTHILIFDYATASADIEEANPMSQRDAPPVGEIEDDEGRMSIVETGGGQPAILVDQDIVPHEAESHTEALDNLPAPITLLPVVGPIVDGPQAALAQEVAVSRTPLNLTANEEGSAEVDGHTNLVNSPYEDIPSSEAPLSATNPVVQIHALSPRAISNHDTAISEASSLIDLTTETIQSHPSTTPQRDSLGGTVLSAGITISPGDSDQEDVPERNESEAGDNTDHTETVLSTTTRIRKRARLLNEEPFEEGQEPLTDNLLSTALWGDTSADERKGMKWLLRSNFHKRRKNDGFLLARKVPAPLRAQLRKYRSDARTKGLYKCYDDMDKLRHQIGQTNVEIQEFGDEGTEGGAGNEGTNIGITGTLPTQSSSSMLISPVTAGSSGRQPVATSSSNLAGSQRTGIAGPPPDPLAPTRPLLGSSEGDPVVFQAPLLQPTGRNEFDGRQRHQWVTTRTEILRPGECPLVTLQPLNSHPMPSITDPTELENILHLRGLHRDWLSRLNVEGSARDLSETDCGQPTAYSHYYEARQRVHSHSPHIGTVESGWPNRFIRDHAPASQNRCRLISDSIEASGFDGVPRPRPGILPHSRESMMHEFGFLEGFLASLIVVGQHNFADKYPESTRVAMPQGYLLPLNEELHLRGQPGAYHRLLVPLLFDIGVRMSRIKRDRLRHHEDEAGRAAFQRDDREPPPPGGGSTSAPPGQSQGGGSLGSRQPLSSSQDRVTNNQGGEQTGNEQRSNTCSLSPICELPEEGEIILEDSPLDLSTMIREDTPVLVLSTPPHSPVSTIEVALVPVILDDPFLSEPCARDIELKALKEAFLKRVACESTETLYQCQWKKWSGYCTTYHEGKLFFEGLDATGILEKWTGFVAAMHQLGIMEDALDRVISAVKSILSRSTPDLSILDSSKGGAYATFLKGLYRRATYSPDERRNRMEKADDTRKGLCPEPTMQAIYEEKWETPGWTDPDDLKARCTWIALGLMYVMGVRPSNTVDTGAFHAYTPRDVKMVFHTKEGETLYLEGGQKPTPFMLCEDIYRIQLRRASSKASKGKGDKTIIFTIDTDLWVNRLMISLTEWIFFNTESYGAGDPITSVYYISNKYKKGPKAIVWYCRNSHLNDVLKEAALRISQIPSKNISSKSMRVTHSTVFHGVVGTERTYANHLGCWQESSIVPDINYSLGALHYQPRPRAGFSNEEALQALPLSQNTVRASSESLARRNSFHQEESNPALNRTPPGSKRARTPSRDSTPKRSCGSKSIRKTTRSSLTISPPRERYVDTESDSTPSHNHYTRRNSAYGTNCRTRC